MTLNQTIKIILIHFILIILLNPGITAQENLDSLKKIWEDSKQNVEKRFAAINRFYVLNTLALI